MKRCHFDVRATEFLLKGGSLRADLKTEGFRHPSSTVLLHSLFDGTCNMHTRSLQACLQGTIYRDFMEWIIERRRWTDETGLMDLSELQTRLQQFYACGLDTDIDAPSSAVELSPPDTELNVSPLRVRPPCVSGCAFF